LYDRVASLFNSWHIQKLQCDWAGFGGKIRAFNVEDFFKFAGRSMLAAKLGVRPTFPPGAVIPPATVNNSGAPLVMTAREIDAMSQKKCRDILKCIRLSTNGTTPELKKRLKKHYRV